MEAIQFLQHHTSLLGGKREDHLWLIHGICKESSNGSYHKVSPYDSCSQVWNKFQMDT